MNKNLDMPTRIARLPRDRHSYPVPWFVAWPDGEPDFRIMDGNKLDRAIRERRCWLCGDPAGRFSAFVIGPMCAVNRISAEPPSHRDCAVYAARICPFLTTPNMVRRDRGKPEGVTDPAGIMLRRNPGVTLIWITRQWRIERDGDGVLFRIGDPTETLWLCEGRPATREEVMASIDSGLPLLREAADQDGPKAHAALDRQYKQALACIPKE